MIFAFILQVALSNNIEDIQLNKINVQMLFLWQELTDLRKAKMKCFQEVKVDESNILVWEGLIVPVSIHPKFFLRVVRCLFRRLIFQTGDWALPFFGSGGYVPKDKLNAVIINVNSNDFHQCVIKWLPLISEYCIHVESQRFSWTILRESK